MPVNRHGATLRVGELTISGVSTGGIATTLAIPELGVCFDVGASPHETVRMHTLLITHCHADHLGALHAWLGVRGLLGMPEATLLVPQRAADDVRSLIETWSRLQRKPFAARIVPARPGEEHRLRRDLTVRPYKSPHIVPSLGYTVYRHKTKLRAEHHGLPGKEIARLRKEGVPGVFDEVSEPLVTYPGDTLIEVVEREESVRRARTLLLEATFLDERKDKRHVRAGGHIHIDDIAARADLFENDHVVLLHFSQIYSAAQVRDLVARKLPERLLRRVHLLVGRMEPATPEEP